MFDNIKYILLSLLLCINVFANKTRINKQHAEIIANIIDKRISKYIKDLKGNANIILKIKRNGIVQYKINKVSNNNKFNEAIQQFIIDENGKFYIKEPETRTISIDIKGKWI